MPYEGLLFYIWNKCMNLYHLKQEVPVWPRPKKPQLDFICKARCLSVMNLLNDILSLFRDLIPSPSQSSINRLQCNDFKMVSLSKFSLFLHAEHWSYVPFSARFLMPDSFFFFYNPCKYLFGTVCSITYFSFANFAFLRNWVHIFGFELHLFMTNRLQRRSLKFSVRSIYL